MKTLTKDYFRELIAVSELIHEEATPLKTLDNPENYEVSALRIKELGDILKKFSVDDAKQSKALTL